MRTVLVVSQHFPPAAGVASARVGKLAKYLPTLGWRPIVLAAPASGRTDDDLLADVDGLDLHFVEPRRHAPTLQRLDWTIAAAPVARRLARDADAVLISGGPFSPLVLGPLLRLPFVVDLRDPWSWEPRFGRLDARARRRLGAAVERRAERFALRRAAAIATVAPEIASGYARRDPDLADRFAVVRHGYDPDDFPAQPPPVADPPTLVHVGSMLAGERTPELLVAAARLVRAQGIPLHVRLIGAIPDELRPAEESWIEVVGPLSHRRAAAEMCAAAVLWVQPGELDFLITGKVYEYLAAGRPIVAVAPATGSVASLLADTGGGLVVDAEAEACAEAVAAALAGDVPAHDEQVVAALAQPEPARRIAELLEEAVRRG